MTMDDPFDEYDTHAQDNDPAIPRAGVRIPAQRPPSDPIDWFPRQPTPEEH